MGIESQVPNIAQKACFVQYSYSGWRILTEIYVLAL